MLTFQDKSLISAEGGVEEQNIGDYTVVPLDVLVPGGLQSYYFQ
jgi:hypothetical protein